MQTRSESDRRSLTGGTPCAMCSSPESQISQLPAVSDEPRSYDIADRWRLRADYDSSPSSSPRISAKRDTAAASGCGYCKSSFSSVFTKSSATTIRI